MQRPGRLTRVESYRIAVLLGVSFGGLFLALAPMALERFGVPEPALWGRASALMVAYSVVAVTVYLASSRHIARQAPEIFNRYLFAGIAIGHFVNIGLQLVNALRPKRPWLQASTCSGCSGTSPTPRSSSRACCSSSPPIVDQDAARMTRIRRAGRIAATASWSSWR